MRTAKAKEIEGKTAAAKLRRAVKESIHIEESAEERKDRLRLGRGRTGRAKVTGTNFFEQLQIQIQS